MHTPCIVCGFHCSGFTTCTKSITRTSMANTTATCSHRSHVAYRDSKLLFLFLCLVSNVCEVLQLLKCIHRLCIKPSGKLRCRHLTSAYNLQKHDLFIVNKSMSLCFDISCPFKIVIEKDFFIFSQFGH